MCHRVERPAQRQGIWITTKFQLYDGQGVLSDWGSLYIRHLVPKSRKRRRDTDKMKVRERERGREKRREREKEREIYNVKSTYEMYYKNNINNINIKIKK